MRCQECHRTFTTTGGDFDPNWTIHPGGAWSEIVEYSEQTVAQVAEALRVDRSVLAGVLGGTRLPELQLCVDFARHFGIEPRFIWQLRCNYQLDVALGKKDVTHQ